MKRNHLIKQTSTFICQSCSLLVNLLPLEARMMLMQAFVGEVIGHVSLEPLRDRLNRLVEKRFRGELTQCEGCRACR